VHPRLGNDLARAGAERSAGERELGIVLAPLTPAQAAALAPENEGEDEARAKDE